MKLFVSAPASSDEDTQQSLSRQLDVYMEPAVEALMRLQA
jgi:hypothetical protein